MQNPFGIFEQLPKTSVPWTGIIYLIKGLQESNRVDSILKGIYQLTIMAHFVPCEENMAEKNLADIILHHG